MKFLVLLSMVCIVGMTSQTINAHPESGLIIDPLNPIPCDYTSVEGVWRINTTSKQLTMNSGGYISFARSKRSTTPEPDEIEFAVTGNAFGKLDKTPVFLRVRAKTAFMY